MSKPVFTKLTPAEFVALVNKFNWKRRVNEVHMHHTWSPDHKAWRGEKSVEGMWSYHVHDLGWSNIAQHITIAPDGAIWLGRNWNSPPASNGKPNRNGNSEVGPFMFETVGNFDKGHDKLEGAQLNTVLTVIAAIQDRFQLRPTSLLFHRHLGSPKTCPGSGVDYDDILHKLDMFKRGGNADPMAVNYVFPNHATFPTRPAKFDDRSLIVEPWYKRVWLTRRFWR